MINLQHKKIGNYIMLTNKKVAQLKHSSVYMGLNTLNKKKVLIKVIAKSQYEKNDVLYNSLNFQLSTMKVLKEQNILKPLQLVMTEKNYYLILEEPHGDSLNKIISKKGVLKQKQLRGYLKKLKEVLNALKKNNIIHGNINTKSVLIDHNKIVLGYPSYVKTIEILKSNSLNDHEINIEENSEKLKEYTYLPPELLTTGIITLKQDIWSLGVIVYQSLFGNLPWDFKQCKKPFQMAGKMISTKIKFPQNITISKQMKHFLIGCLQIDPIKRLCWEDVLEHPVFIKQLESFQEKNNDGQVETYHQRNMFDWSSFLKIVKTNSTLNQ